MLANTTIYAVNTNRILNIAQYTLASAPANNFIINKNYAKQNNFNPMSKLSNLSNQSSKQNNPNNQISNLNQNYEFIFFYSTNCQHCISFSPILKKYSDDFGIQVKAFVIGNKASTYFPSSVAISQEIINQFFGSSSNLSVPALFILNKNNYHAYPVSSGSLSYLELTARMEDLIPKILQHEKYGSNL